MQTIKREVNVSKTLKESAVSIPSTLYASKIFGKDIEIDSNCCAENLFDATFSTIWDKQHPLIHTWLVLSCVSICFLSALLFIIH